MYLPGQLDDAHQPRPALVISEDTRNRFADDVIVVPIFSRGRGGPTRVAVQAGTGGITHDSVIYGEEITTLDTDFLHRGPLGPLAPGELLDSVVLAVRRALGEVIPY